MKTNNQYIDVRYLKIKKEFRSKLNKCKEIKYYMKNNDLDLEKIINDYSTYIVTIVNNMASESLNDEDKIDDNNFDMNINIKFDSNYNLSNMLSNNGKINIMDLKVVNEKNEKIFATRELESKEMQSLYKTEQEAIKNYDSYMGAYSENIERISDNEIKFYLTATGNPKSFPTSQKLIISFNEIQYRYFENNEEKNIIYKGEWNYKIDVPSKMAKSNVVQYKL